MRVTTWNLQGREGLDLDAAASVLLRSAPDVVALQEVQRAQAVALAYRLGFDVRWWFKHWTVVHPAEGLALLTPEPLDAPRRVLLAAGWRFWSWRRRVAGIGNVDGTLLVDVHLGSGVGDAERARQAGIVVDAVAGAGRVVVTGDFNTKPGSVVMDVFERAGFVDAWAFADPGIAAVTNWRKGPRRGAPTQLLDYALVRGLAVTDVVVGDGRPPNWDALASLSDHAPVTVELTPLQ